MGFSKITLDVLGEFSIELESILISILYNCFPIVLRYWLVKLFCSMTLWISVFSLDNLKGEAFTADPLCSMVIVPKWCKVVSNKMEKHNRIKE